MLSHISPVMTVETAIHFRKMNGLGNDFVVLDGRRSPFTISNEQARAIA